MARTLPLLSGECLDIRDERSARFEHLLLRYPSPLQEEEHLSEIVARGGDFVRQLALALQTAGVKESHSKLVAQREAERILRIRFPTEALGLSLRVVWASNRPALGAAGQPTDAEVAVSCPPGASNRDRVEAYKKRLAQFLKKRKVTDEELARRANPKWTDRTPIIRFKSGKGKLTEGDRIKIENLLAKWPPPPE